MPLTIKLADLSVTFDSFVNSEYPRVTVQPASVEYSALGTPALSARYYENKHLWSVNAICDRHQRETLELILWESEDRRRKLLNADILIYDTTAAIRELAPRSRGLVPNTTETIINGRYVAYYAQFYGIITTDLKYSISGIVDVVTFSIAETVRVLP